MRRISPVGLASIDSDAGLGCSVRRFSSMAETARLRSQFTASNTGFFKGSLRRLQPEPRGVFRGHKFQAAAEDLNANGVLITDGFERLQEAGEIDNAFAGHEPLVIHHLLRRLHGGI